MDSFAFGAAFLAGILTILSPCVLPILSIIFGTASNTHRLGPVALGLGLSFGFAAIGLFVATIGFSIGLNPDIFRTVSAVMLIAFGVIILVPAANQAFQKILAPIGNLASRGSDNINGNSLGGQFGLGLLLGAVWSPCVGPTLGAATLLASQGEALFQVALVMTVFGIGVALPLSAIGFVGRQAFTKMRGKIVSGGNIGKWLLGAGMLLAGLLTLTGWDKQIEIWALDNGPGWATEWSTRY